MSSFLKRFADMKRPIALPGEAIIKPMEVRLREMVDEMSRELLTAKLAVIGERSGDIYADSMNALYAINVQRRTVNLPPIPTPDHLNWTGEDDG